MKSSYFFDKNGVFIIENYNAAKPFSSFLPGIAGILGIPMWTFYVNRGQCVASFGIQDKNKSVLEFFPANKSYQLVPFRGFRTFVKIYTDKEITFYEPFSSSNHHKRIQKMKISNDSLELEELSQDYGLQFNISYFTIPNEDFAALARRITIKNNASRSIDFEILDGLPVVIPFGANEFSLKAMSYTLESWMRVENLKKNIPFYKMAQLPGDEPTIDEVNAGNFYLTFIQQNGTLSLLKPLVDPFLVFARNTAFSFPDGYLKQSLDEIYMQKQVTTNKTPCGFFGTNIFLKPAQEFEIFAIIGHAPSIDWLNKNFDRIATKNFFDSKYQENRRIIASLTENVNTKTSSTAFDLYCRQTYLDNLLRGGYPFMIKKNELESIIFHIYIRKHGDLERDYNFFSLEPTYYSQGNGNYRDVNQNRRSEVQMNPQVRHTNILTFMNLIQPDGYNPLEIRGSRFKLTQEKASELVKSVDKKEKLHNFLVQPFTPGQLIKFLKISGLNLSIPLNDFFTEALILADQSIEAVFGQGYWIDHWTYNLDLIESYLSIYPEKEEELLFELAQFTYYDSPAVVLPREEKTVLLGDKVRQVGAVVIDKRKETIFDSRTDLRHVIRDDFGNGAIYRTTLFTKLLNLVAIKFATFDPWGMGIEMEANKPSWYDALNGLPGIFGSSMSETFELHRLITFMLKVITERKKRSINMPIEVFNLLMAIQNHIEVYNKSNLKNKDYIYWDQVAGERETYRENIKYGFNGEEVEIALKQIEGLLRLLLQKIDQGISRAIELNGNQIPTYFYFEVEEYEMIYDEKGNVKTTENGFPRVRIKKFSPVPLPLFLEGFVRALKIQKEKESARKIWKQVRESKLYDQKLKMYKLNVSLLDQPKDIGRAKAFTPGWLENESIWMHMEYKFLFELAKSGLFKEFIEDFRNVLVPFQQPTTYGRNPTENSSFIVSSAFPDESLHGTGYYARLSGATAEFLSIWFLMFAGKTPFFFENNVLCLEFKPILPGWLFDENGLISFKFLGTCQVTYHNPKKLNTYETGLIIKEISLQLEGNSTVKINGSVIKSPYASMIRSGEIKSIDIVLDTKN